MLKHMFLRFAGLSLALSLILTTQLLLVVSASAEDNREWSFVVAPYLLFPSITGDTSAGRVDGVDIDVDPGDIFGALELGGMLQLEAHHDDGFGVIVNYAFMDLGDDASGPAGIGDLGADIFQGMMEVSALRRWKTNSSSFDLYSGLRWWDIDIDVDATIGNQGRTFRSGNSWVDPVIGGRWITSLSENWRFYFQGDVGGFDLVSQFTWDVVAGLSWDAGENFSLIFMYEALGVDYESGREGTADFFAYDTITSGPFLGVVFYL